MKKLKTITFTALACIMLACSCEKPAPPLTELPPITQTGANTFGCYVNGNLFVPTEPWLYVFPEGVPNPHAGFSDQQFNLEASGLIDPNIEKGERYYFSVIIYDFIGVGHYDFENNSIEISFDFTDSCFYSNPTRNGNLSGSIDITYLNKEAKIISGIFNLKVGLLDSYNDRDYKCDSIVNITEGRFDIKIN
ncbi:MAG: hypothetical protein WCX31_22340 [Salinivirgaceae bacterium]|jgi:hypothetical protein